MGAIHGHPEHFHEWLAERGEPVAEEAFLPRGLYATYIRDLLASAEREAADARLRRHCGEVVSIVEQHGAAAAPLELTLADGERIEADRVILALGPLGAGDPIRVPPELKAVRRLRRRPLGGRRARRGAARPLGADRRHRPLDGRRRALALRGRGRAADPRRLPPRPGAAPPPPRPDQPAPLPHPDRDRDELEPIVAAIFAQICRVSQQGDDWRDVIDSMRPVTPPLWKSLRTSRRSGAS